MDKLPTQLRWAQFVKALEKLGYTLSKSLAGAGRTFVSKTRVPYEVSFHEPHGGKPIPNGTLSEYLRKLKLTRDEFFALLAREKNAQRSTQEESEQFRHYTDDNGLITSVCGKCFEKVVQSIHLHEVEAAEAVHPCYLPSLAD